MNSRFFKYESKHTVSSKKNESLELYLKFKKEFKHSIDINQIEKKVFKKNRDPKTTNSSEENDILYRAPAKIGELFTVEMLINEYINSIALLKKLLMEGNDVAKPLISLEIIYNQLPTLLSMLEYKGDISDETPQQCTIL